MQLQYSLIRDEWVDLISVTPINKVTSYYDGLNLIIQNETYLVLLFLNDKGNLETTEETEYSLKGEIRVKSINS